MDALMERKRRILFVGEASFIATGFGVYWNEVIKRLHETGDFSIAELGGYASDGDPQIQSVPWKFYPVQPHPNDQRAQQIFRSKPTYQFGENRFDDVCIDFKPDVVCAIRDAWMDEFILRSPFRKHFKLIWMPTIDGEPQRDLWLDMYKRCDGILTYSEYGMNLLKRTGRPGTNLITIASPGADIEVFKPAEDKKAHKKKLGIDPESFIIGITARNQKRKLYRDLIEAFSMWVYKAKSKGHTDLVRKTFLYLHTSYPDVGYDIGSAIKEFKVANKVIMTYLCAKCGTAFPARFAGSTMNCIKCSQLTAHPPNASHQCPRHILADIMKCFDLYVQYSICWNKGSPVLMHDYRYKNIEDVEIGDKVITHDHKIQTVTKKFTSKPTDSVGINIYGDYQSYKCTKNHPLLTQRGWISAGELCKSDWLCYPIRQVGNDKLPIDPYLLGIMLGDGWLEKTRNKFGISLGYPKQATIQYIEKYLKSNQINHYSRDRNGGAVEFTWKNDSNLLPYSQSLMGGSRRKNIPSDMMNVGRKDLAKLIRGLFHTDGHVSPIDYRYYTSSQILANQVRSVLLQIGIVSSIFMSDNRPDEYAIIVKDLESKEMMHAIMEGKDPPIRKNKSKRNIFLKIENGYLWSKIKSVQDATISDEVYNLEVENTKGGDANSHSYVVGWIISHNCEGW